MVTLLLVTVVFYAFPTRAQFTDPPIKIGILGPMHWIQGKGMEEGASLAALRINEVGGINGHRVDLYFASTHPDAATDPTDVTGGLAMEELMDIGVPSWRPLYSGVDFAVGGFRSEACFGAREVAMDNLIIYSITGCGTDGLIDDGKTPAEGGFPGVDDNYARYKYLFRNTPMNVTTLAFSIFGFLKFAMIAKLMPLYTGYAAPLRITVVSELAVWADGIHAILSNELFWNYHPAMNLIAYGGVDVIPDPDGIPASGDEGYRGSPVDPGWVTGTVADIDAGPDGTPGTGDEARLIIEALSGPVGRDFVSEWATIQPDAALVGIDVPGQEIPDHWDATGGLAETETFLATAGGGPGPTEGTPINTEGPITTQDYYSDYWNTIPTLFDPPRAPHAPIYTSYGVFDTLWALKEAIETWVTIVGHDWPPADQAEYDLLVPIIEATDRHGVVGWFKYTGPHPMGPAAYPPEFAAVKATLGVPTMKGTLHDLWTQDLGPTWPTGYVRALQASWQAGRLEVVFPMDQPYSKIWAIPDWMYPYPTDVDQNGIRDITDIAIVSYAIGTSPGDSRWQFVADYDGNWFVNTDDLSSVAFDFGVPIPVPLG